MNRYPLTLLLSLSLTLSGCPEPNPVTPHPASQRENLSKKPSIAPKSASHRAQVMGPNTAGVDWHPLSKPEGALGNGREDVSGIFSLNTPAGLDISSLTLVLPLALSNPPYQKQDFYLESRKTSDSDWQMYQPRYQAFSASDQVWVFVPRPSPKSDFQTAQSAVPPQYRLIHAPASDPLNRYITVQREGSVFEVSYLPFNLKTSPAFAKHVIPTDSDWQSQAPGSLAQDPQTPDYIEDLIRALDSGLAALLQLQKTTHHPALPAFQTGPANGTGDFKYLQSHTTPLFLAPKKNVEVQVLALADSGGESPLGGPIKLRNRFDNQDDLLTTTTHELVHVLQGQYLSTQALTLDEILHIFNEYSLGLWFVDASAVFLTAKALQLEPERSKTYYSQFLGLDYLGRSLTHKSDSSMYPLGHFLDWLDRTYHPTLVENVLAQGALNPINALDQELKATGKVTGLGDAWTAYGQFLLHNQEDTAGFANTATTNLEIFSQTYLHGGVSKGRLRSLSESAPPVSQSGEMDSLSMALTVLYAERSQSETGWLVIASETQADLQQFSYPLASLINSQLSPGQKALETTDPQTAPQVIKNFGPQAAVKGLLQLHVNRSSHSKIRLNRQYYLVLPPQIHNRNSQSVSWKTDSYHDLPKGYIQVFEIYQDGLLLGEVSPDTAAEMQSFSSDLLKDFGSQVQVVLRDQFGNRLPEIEKKAGILKLLISSAGGVDILDSQTGNVSHSVIPGTEVRIQAQATASEDLPVNWVYETIYDCGQGALEWHPENEQLLLKSDNSALAVKVTAISQKNPQVKSSVTISFVQPFSIPCTAE